MRTVLTSLTGILLLTLHSFCSAMTVVADHGGIPAAQFYERMNIEQPTAGPGPGMGGVSATRMLPAMSKLSPGTVHAKPVRLATLPAPLFIVSDDPLSLTWLEQNQETLQRLQAIGWAVNVRDAAALERIRSAVPGLGVQAMHVDDFAQRLGLQHYPALITRTRVEQ